jgi:hypothetical protein
LHLPFPFSNLPLARSTDQVDYGEHMDDEVKDDPIDTHVVILAALVFFLIMAVFAALGFQP